MFSLQAIKHLTTGDGGLITLPNKKLYDRCKLLRWYGIDRDKRNYKGKDFRLEHDIKEYGYKFHMNDINATIGLENMRSINWILERCRENGKYYEENLKNIKGLRLMENKNDRKSSYWLYTMFVERKYEFINKMKEYGIMASQVHQRNDVHSCVKEFESHLPKLDRFEKGLVCLPVGWWIDKKAREFIVDCVKKGW